MAAPTTFDQEAFYDAEIAPALLDLAQKCAAKSVPFLALVQYVGKADGKGEYGETAVRLDLSRALTAASSAHHDADATPHVSGIAMMFHQPRPGFSN